MGGGLAFAAAVLFLSAAAALEAGERSECPDAVADRMVSSRIIGAQSGECPAEGKFIVAVSEVEPGVPPGASRTAGLRLIGEMLDVEVQGRSEMASRERVQGDKVEFSSFFESASRTSVHTALSGVQARGVRQNGNRAFAVFVLSDATIRASTELASAAAQRPDGPAQVESLGFAPIRSGDVAAAKEAAQQMALRGAVEMVMGLTVVGQSASRMTDEELQFRDRVFSDTMGFVDRFEVLSEGREGEIYSVRVRAIVVPKKLLDSYQSLVRSVGDPQFFIDSRRDEYLEAKLIEFFKGKGLRIARSERGADYIIEARSIYSEVADPRDVTGDRKGTRVEISFSIFNAKTEEQLAGLRTDGRAANFLQVGEARQRQLACEAVLEKEGAALHEQLQEFISGMLAGRRISVLIGGIADLDDGEMRDRFLGALLELPNVTDVQPRIARGRLELELIVRGRTDSLGLDIVRCLLDSVRSGSARVLEQSTHQIVIGP